jgi:hypothetical protein
MRLAVFAATFAAASFLTASPAQAQRCDIPREARDIWRCDDGFVVGAENVIIRLPIPETDPETLFNAGLEAAQREDWRVAIAYFTAAHQRAHLVPRYIYNLGLAHARAGHDLPAMAWLVAYLTAEPNAPNRAAVWAEIDQIETRVRANIDAFWALGVQAADSLPNEGSYTANPRWEAYGNLALAAVQTSDLDRARIFLTTRAPMCGTDNTCGRSVDAELGSDHFRGYAYSSALFYDFDPVAAEAIRAQMSAPHRGVNQHLFDRARGERLVAMTGVHFEPTFTALPSDDLSGALRGLRVGELDGLYRYVGIDPVRAADPFLNTLLLAARNEIDALFLRLAQATPGATSSVNWESLAFMVGEMLLARGDRPSAERAYAEWGRLRDEGWVAGQAGQRLGGLLIADTGRISDALAMMEVAAWRLTSSGDPNPALLADRWFAEKGGSAAVLAEYFLIRGRIPEALQTVARTNSLRRVLFFETALRRPDLDTAHADEMRALLTAALNEAAQGCARCIARRIAIENAVSNAAVMGPMEYDISAELRSIAAERDARVQLARIVYGVPPYLGQLRQVKGLYRRSGGTWGQ